MLKKVILSHRGEVTEDRRIVGDTVRYRIYYGATATAAIPEITISDKLDKRLGRIHVLNDGSYDPRTRTISWTVPARRLKRNAFVEFEATLEQPGLVTNQANAKGRGIRAEKSNKVTVDVSLAPRLGWLPFRSDVADGAPPRAYLKDETTTGITVRFDIPGLFIHQERVDGVAYQHVTVPGIATTTVIGRPELPVVGEVIEVPFDVSFTPRVVSAETVRLSGYHVYPAQEPRIDAAPRVAPSLAKRNVLTERLRPRPPAWQALAGRRSFELDATTYQTGTDYPETPVAISTEDIGVIRGHRVLLLKVNPVLCNPVAQTLTVYRTIEVRVGFSRPAQVKGVNSRLRSHDFESLLAATLLNYKPQERFMPEGLGSLDKQTPGCDYLILTHDAFYTATDATNPVVRLANWKRRKGYRTKVVKVGSIPGGNTATAIETYLQTAYDTWSPPPSYVLLVGDADLVHTADGDQHPAVSDPLSPQPRIGTDLLYATVDGTDYFPDIFIGRLPADSLQQATDMVDKIITYEQLPPATPANAGFYTNVSLVGLFTETNENPDVITGQEDRPWIANMETIRNFLQGEGYTVERIYQTDTGFPGAPAAQDPQRFHDGTGLPNDLLSPQFGWNGGTNNITNAMNAGRFLLTYRGHGAWNGWAQPSFSSNNALALAQSDLTPLVISITCQTGWFDNETDDDAHGGRPVADDSFAEVLLRRPRSGAVGLVGMTRNSYTGWNDYLIFGAHKAIWPNFQPNPPWAGHPAAPPGQQVSLRKLGQITNFSKMYMARAYVPSTTRRIEFQMHHLFGDPEMVLWSSAPQELHVEPPQAIGAKGLQEFVIAITDQVTGHGIGTATVVLTRDDEIVQMRQTRTDGLALFSLVDVGDGDLDLTVTALDYRPVLTTLPVTPKGAELNVLDPDDGPESQVFHVGGRFFDRGEDVELHFGTDGPTVANADGSGAFGQGIPTFDLTVPAAYPHGLLNLCAFGARSKRAAVRIFQVRDKNPVDLWTYDQCDSSTWSVHPGDNPTWNSPDIQLYDASNNPVDSNNLVLGQDYTVKVKVRNKEAFAAPGAKVVFRWENFGAGGPWQDLPPIVTADIPAGPAGVTEVQTTFQPSATGHVCLQASIEHLEDIASSNQTGQENLHVGFSSSPTRVCFTVWNPSTQPAPVHFEVRQLFEPSSKDRTLWGTWVEHPDPQFLEPGDRAEACVVVDPGEAKVRPGAKAEFAVTCFVAGTMIGGVNLIVIKR